MASFVDEGVFSLFFYLTGLSFGVEKCNIMNQKTAL